MSSTNIEVLHFACQCESDECVKNGTRVLGLMTDRLTGSTLDIFMYRQPKVLRPWQDTHTRWLERSNDAHADYTFPEQELLPLQTVTFLNTTAFLPRNPRTFLQWEYGSCLGIHVAPYRLCVFSPATTWAYWIVSLVDLYWCGWRAFVPLCLLELFGRSGVSLILMSFFRILCGRHRVISILVIALALFDMRGCVEQLICDAACLFGGNLRPRTITICVFQCMDFHI